MDKTTYKICFMARPWYDTLSTGIYKVMKSKENIQACFVTTTEDETKTVRKLLGTDQEKIFQLDHFMKEHWDEFNLSKLHEIEEKYDCAPIWNLIYTDRFLITKNYDYSVKTTVGCFLFFESIFTTGAYQFYYDEAISTLFSYAGYYVGKKYGVEYLTQNLCRTGLDEFHYFSNDPYLLNCLFDENYLAKEYSQKEQKKAMDFLQEFEEHEQKPEYMNISGREPKFHWSFMFLPVGWLMKRFRPKNNNPFAYIYYKLYANILDPAVFYFRYHFSKRYYHKADFDKKYVLFPLHFQPETTTLVWAAKYEKQLFLIDSLAKSLPSDTLLYVKEHYACLGHRTISFYKQLRNYPNVILISPWENTRELSLKAEAVVVLTSTVGWEAALMRRPVILCGRVFYENMPGVMRVNDIYNQYQSTLNAWKKPTRDDIAHYLCEFFRTIYQGKVHDSPEIIPDPEENYQLLANSLLSVMRRYLPSP